MGYISHRSEKSVEDYLETIYILSMRLPTVRSIDIVNEMNFSKPSVSVAMKNLKNKSYIDISGAGHITLSEAGLKLAAEIYERHTVLTDWLISLQDGTRYQHPELRGNEKIHSEPPLIHENVRRATGYKPHSDSV